MGSTSGGGGGGEFTILFLDVYTCTYYPASRGRDIFAEWAGVRTVASADNRSIFYRECAKFVTRLARKINPQVCRQMTRVSRELKKMRQLLSATYARLTLDSRNALNRSRTGKTCFFQFIRQYFSTDLNGCRQRLRFALQLTQCKCSLCSHGMYIYALFFHLLLHQGKGVVIIFNNRLHVRQKKKQIKKK